MLSLTAADFLHADVGSVAWGGEGSQGSPPIKKGGAGVHAHAERANNPGRSQMTLNYNINEKDPNSAGQTAAKTRAESRARARFAAGLAGGSTAACNGNSVNDRTCRFQNLCYRPSSNEYVFLQGPVSSMEGVPTKRFEPAVATLGSLQDHNLLHFSFIDAPASAVPDMLKDKQQAADNNNNDNNYMNRRMPGGMRNNHVDATTASKEESITMVTGASLLLFRFKPDNIFHAVHDDALPALQTMWHGLGRSAAGGTARPFRIVTVDPWPSSGGTKPAERILEAISYGGLLRLHDLSKNRNPGANAAARAQMVCFEEAYIGINKATTWYQYGFDKPQGPLLPHAPGKGRLVKQGADFIARQLLAGSSLHNDKGEGEGEKEQVGAEPRSAGGSQSSQSQQQKHVVLFSRTRNRLLLNEQELCDVLAVRYSRPVTILRMETHSLEAQIEILQHTEVAIGLHGSALIMAMFLPPGAILLELFPYGIVADRYTPYKTLAELDELGISYLHWTNSDESASVAHPARAAHLGGIAHLPPGEQIKIKTSNVPVHLCCTNPYWLYRIYQDTIVDVAAIVGLLSASQHEQQRVEQRFAPSLPNGATVPNARQEFVPGKVDQIACKTQHLGAQKAPTWQLRITFNPPWNVAMHLQQQTQPFTVTYEVFGQELGIVWQTSDPQLILEGDEVFALPAHTLWIRAKLTFATAAASEPVHGPYAPAFVCNLW